MRKPSPWAVARELTDLINRQPGMRAVMTRTGDYFVDLNARSEIARRQKAQLLISIHADSVDNATARRRIGLDPLQQSGWIVRWTNCWANRTNIPSCSAAQGR